MRELKELSAKRVYNETVIRVQFPDRMVFCASFHPHEVISSLVKELKKCLVVTEDFYLYLRYADGSRAEH